MKKNLRIGFIGTGNMGSALIKGILKSGSANAKDIFAYDVDTPKLQALKSEYGINAMPNNMEVVKSSDYIILAVKPYCIKDVLYECREKLNGEKVIVSLAVGVPIKTYKEITGGNCRIVRVMPNTPALVGEGMTLICFDENISGEDRETVTNLFGCVGKVETLEEALMTEVTALTGSSPAYVFMFIEAMADAAVLSGIPRALSYKLAAQSVLGAAKMVLESGRHPGELKDQVCSPAGTTLEAVKALEKNAFRYAVMDAMGKCTERAREISRIYG